MEDLQWMDLKSLIEEKGVKNKNKSFIFFEDRVVTYKELHETSNIIAHNFQRLGISKGDHVLVFLHNSPEYIMIWFALAKLGAVMIPLNTALRRHDLTYIIDRSDARTIILETELLQSYQEVRNRNIVEKEIIVTKDSSESLTDMIPFSSLLGGSAENLDTKIEMSDPLCIIYTSGTTGKPKGAILPHFCYIHSGITFAKCFGLKAGDRMLTTFPLFHVGAQQLIIMPAMVADISFALIRRFSASQFWDQVRKYNSNIVHYLGSILQILYREKEQSNDADNPAKIMIGVGATMDLWEKFEKRFNVRLLEGYGLTESGLPIAHNDVEKVKVGSIGLPDPNQRVEVANENDKVLPPNTVGKIIIRPELPYTMMLGYYKDPQATVEAYRNLWFHTGDIGYKDDEGFLYFVGRESHFIRRRGENVSGEEVEEVINSHPGVIMSGVVGVPSEIGDDEVKAYIVLKDKGSLAPGDIISWCEDKIAYFKIPRYIEFVDQLPMTETNRVERYKLKQRGVGDAWDREKTGYQIKKGNNNIS
jgi:crotonobetaine/carnitine-CoA ligase